MVGSFSVLDVPRPRWTEGGKNRHTLQGGKGRLKQFAISTFNIRVHIRGLFKVFAFGFSHEGVGKVGVR